MMVNTSERLQSETSPLQKIPQELRDMIFTHLTPLELIRVKCASRDFKALIEDSLGCNDRIQAFFVIKSILYREKSTKGQQEAIIKAAKENPTVALIAVFYKPSVLLLLKKYSCIRAIVAPHSAGIKQQILQQALEQIIQISITRTSGLIEGNKIPFGQYSDLANRVLGESLKRFDFARVRAITQELHIQADPTQVDKIANATIEKLIERCNNAASNPLWVQPIGPRSYGSKGYKTIAMFDHMGTFIKAFDAKLNPSLMDQLLSIPLSESRFDFFSEASSKLKVLENLYTQQKEYRINYRP